MPAPAGVDAVSGCPVARPLEFTTSHLPLAGQFDAWRDQCSALLDMSERRAVGTGYRASHRIWKLGAMAFSHVRAEAVAYRRTAAHVRRDSLDHWILGYARRGNQQLRTGTATVDVPAGTVQVFSLHEPFDGWREDIDWLTLIVSRDQFPELAPRIDAAMHRPLEGATGALLGQYLGILADNLPRMTAEELPRVAEATRAMLGACIFPDGESLAAAQVHIDSTGLARLKAIIRRNLRSPTLGPRRLCSLGGISRSQLYRLFEPLGGVASYIQAERLRHAHRALSEPSDTRDIVRIAEEFGFYDASTFSRAFRREFGLTPSEVRLAAQAGRYSPPARRAAAAPTGFTDLLRQL
jgi:AraC-like DNA-binding protein